MCEMKMLRRITLLWILFVSTLPGQVETGRIIGTVSDGTGAAIPSAAVIITNVETGRSTKVQTDARGLYRSIPLTVGTYRVEAEAAGFKKAVRRWKGAQSPADGSARADLRNWRRNI